MPLTSGSTLASITANQMQRLVHPHFLCSKPESQLVRSLAPTHIYPATLSTNFVIMILRKCEDWYCADHSRRSICRPPTFKCSSDVGAVLALPKGATVYQETNREQFCRHASRHALAWYKDMLNKGMNISNGSVYFVTECTKSVNWGIAVFYKRPMANHSIRFISDGESHSWACWGKVEARVGPESTDITVSDSGEPNQCVFLRGFKIMLRSDVWEKLKSTTTLTSDDGRFSSPPIPGTSHSPNNGRSGSRADSFHQSGSDNRNTPDSQVRGHRGLQADHYKQVRDVILEEFFSETPPVCILIFGHLFQVLNPLYQLHPSDMINAMLLHLVRFHS